MENEKKKTKLRLHTIPLAVTHCSAYISITFFIITIEAFYYITNRSSY